ncbi:MAG: sensor histidine kinase [Phycisphaerales bacterium]
MTNGVRTKRLRLFAGESIAGAVGLMTAIVVVVALACAGWWSAQTLRASGLSVAESERSRLASLLADAVGEALESQDLELARALFQSAVAGQGFREIRLVAADGASLITVGSKAPTDDDIRRGAIGEGQTIELALSSSGGERLVCTFQPPDFGMAMIEVQTGIFLSVLVGLLGVWLVFRRVRGQLKGMEAVREALATLESSEATPQILNLSPALGPEASHWNRLVEQLQDLQENRLAERVELATGDRRQPQSGGLLSAYDSLSQGLILVDPMGRVMMANGAATMFLGRSRDEIVESDAALLIENEKLRDAIKLAVEGELNRAVVVELESEPGESSSVLRFSVRRMRNSDDASALIMIEDITQQRTAERARQSFVAHATHELRTPLTNIRLSVETAIEAAESDPVMRSKCLNVINQEARRLERVIGEMLSHSEIEAGAFRLRRDEVPIVRIVEQLREDFESQATQREIDLQFDLPPKFHLVTGDSEKLTLVLHNLLGNAVKYTPGGGTVTVKVESTEEEFVFSVADTGIGMTEDDAKRVFEPYFRASDERVAQIPGTGLGLPLAKEIVERHGGVIEVESTLNKGSVFRVRLAQRAAKEAA